jgi:molybdopterin synthase sulfur carrier subunit
VNISIRFFGHLRAAVGCRQVNFIVNEETTVGELPHVLIAAYGDKISDLFNGGEEPFDVFRVLINGQDNWVMQGLDTELKEGDVVTLLPPLSGGTWSNS